MAFLELKNISKSYPTPKGPRSVLENVNLRIEEGEFVSVVGYSGSGKTTLISMIAGLLKQDRGEILLEGRPIDGPGPDRGIIFQNYSLLPWMTVLENVLLAVESVAPHLSTKEKKERAEHFIGLVKLEAAMKKLPRELSGGMRQRVSVARGLATNPKILLLDEPFSALDALTRSNLQKELARIWTENRMTVLMITNDVDEAIVLADKIYPLTAAPGSTIGMEIPVPLPHPRSLRHLSLNPDYQRARREIVKFLTGQRTGKDKPAPALMKELAQA